MRKSSAAGNSLSNPVVYIYADESCLGNQFTNSERPGGAAGLIERLDPSRGWHRRDFRRFDPDTTNNRMALESGIAGLSTLRRRCDVVFTSDSQYLVRGMKEWIHGWARRGWRRRGGPIENLDLWKELLKAAGRHRVEWRWVKGHAEHPKNEYANMLAVATAASGESWPGAQPSGFDAWLRDQIGRGRFPNYRDVPPEEPFRPDSLPSVD